MNIKRAKIGRFEILKKIRKGINCKVKLGRDPNTQEQVAFKIIPDEIQKKNVFDLDREISIFTYISTLNHKNIVKLLDYNSKAEYIKKNGVSKKVCAITMEYVPNGDLYGYLNSASLFNEDVARTFFHTLIGVVEVLHDECICHGDLRAENILLDADFNLKVIDFSYASKIDDKFSILINLKDRLSYQNYAPPEVYMNEEVDKRLLDLFSCGVLLFTMATGSAPFTSAQTSDGLYKLLVFNKSDMFWKTFEKGTRSFSVDFKNLIASMLAPEPAQRLTIAEIKSHPWYNGPTVKLEELKQAFLKKKEENLLLVQKKTEEEEKRKKFGAMFQDKSIKLPSYGYTGLRSRGELSLLELGSSLNETGIAISQLITRDYIDTGYKEMTEFFIAQRPEIIFQVLVRIAKIECNPYIISTKYFKLFGTVIEQDYRVVIEIEIQKVNDQISCVIFNIEEGSLIGFYKVIGDKFKKYLQAL
jgi:serine/threonine protein kinase